MNVHRPRRCLSSVIIDVETSLLQTYFEGLCLHPTTGLNAPTVAHVEPELEQVEARKNARSRETKSWLVERRFLQALVRGPRPNDVKNRWSS